MKDSGLPWIGQIPSNWRCLRGKYVLEYLQKPTKEDDGVITCFRDGEVTLRSNRREEGFTISEKEIGYQGIDIGDLVVHGMDGFAGSIGMSDSRGKASPVLVVLDSKENKRYLMYYLRNLAYRDVFLALATGIRVRSCDLRWNKLAETVLVLPPLDEQNAIVAFLDEKLSKADAAIVEAKELIENYKKFKQSIISEAVTKGINSNTSMKNSGVDWIGMIPQGWKTKKGKYLFTLRNERGNKIELQLLSPTQKYGCIPQTLYEELTTANTVKLNDKTDLNLLKTIHVGDFCISLRSFQGGFEYSNYEGVVSPAYQVFFPESEDLHRGYYKYLFKEQSFIAKMNSYTLTLRDGKTISFTDDFGITEVPIPPKEEQEAIANYLDQKCSQIDSIIEQKEQLIVQLQEYKKSIIFEYVTGKKEIPNG